MASEPVLPDYEGACISNIVPALLEPGDEPPAWLPAEVLDAERVVLLVLDGLGWEQLADRAALAPTLRAMAGGPVTTVAPSTTSTALTSIATGTARARLRVVGYRMAVDPGVLNVLRWSVGGRDARQSVPPDKLQPIEAFCGHRPAIVTRAEFRDSGFTQAHLEGSRFHGYRVTSTLVGEIGRLAHQDEPFVYAYYDGIDKVSHEYGLGDLFDEEVAAVDHLVADVLGHLPPGTALLVTADHGQVHVGERVITPDSSLLAQTALQSGEGRFRWFHARPGRAGALLEAAEQHHGDVAWVVSREQVEDEQWFGPVLGDTARAALGDVALVAHAPVAFHDPDDSGPYRLVGRHGSLTSAEMLVPLLARTV